MFPHLRLMPNVLETHDDEMMREPARGHGMVPSKPQSYARLQQDRQAAGPE